MLMLRMVVDWQFDKIQEEPKVAIIVSVQSSLKVYKGGATFGA